MVELVFGNMTTMDLVMAGLTGILSFAILAIVFKMSLKGLPRWQGRKIVHVSLGSFIALTVPAYSNLSGPSLNCSFQVAEKARADSTHLHPPSWV